MERAGFFEFEGRKIPLDLLYFVSGKDASPRRDPEEVFDSLSPSQRRALLDIDLPLLDVLKEMESAGLKVDKRRLEALQEEVEDAVEELERKIEGLLPVRINLNSPRQIAFVLYEKLGLPVIKRAKTHPSTSEKTLRKLIGLHPVIEHLLDYRELTKVLNSYIIPLLSAVREDGKIYTKFSLVSTQTGRITAIEPNLQTIPIRSLWGRQIRSAFISRFPGGYILSADYSQIELRVLAHLSQDPTLMSAFERGEDIHSSTAGLLFGISKQDVGPKERDIAKRVNFGIVYGITPQGLAEDVDLTHGVAKDFIDRYFRMYPGVKRFISDTIASAHKRGWVETMFGHRRYVPELRSKNRFRRSFGERVAVNTVIQGSAAEIIKLAMLDLHRRMQGYRSQMILQIHDELLFDVHPEELEELRPLIVGAMTEAVRLSVPLEVDVRVGKDWLEASK